MKRVAALALLLLTAAPAAHAQSADRDGDGILDATDVCPSDAEDPNHFEDTDGCPDEIRRVAAATAQAEAEAHERHESQRQVAVCYDAARKRTTSARGGFTTYESAIEAWSACLPATPQPEPVRLFVKKLTLEHEDLSRAHGARHVAKRHTLADDYASKARVQYTLGAGSLLLGAAGVGTGLGFAFGQPLGRGEISNTVVGGVLLGFGIIFSIQSYLLLDAAQANAKSAKSIRPVALTASGLEIVF